MATYTELFDLRNNSGLQNRITVACVIQAEAIRSEDGGTANHAVRLLWAKSVFADPAQAGAQMLWAVLAGNASATVAQITGATDAQILTKVAAAVDVFATGA